MALAYGGVAGIGYVLVTLVLSMVVFEFCRRRTLRALLSNPDICVALENMLQPGQRLQRLLLAFVLQGVLGAQLLAYLSNETPTSYLHPKHSGARVRFLYRDPRLLIVEQANNKEEGMGVSLKKRVVG